MVHQPEFMLERLVHHVLREESRAARELIGSALVVDGTPDALLAHVVIPAIECMHQLREDALVSARVFNAGGRVLSSLVQHLESHLPPAAGPVSPQDRRARVLVLSAPGERTDLGAQAVAALAAAFGFEVHFAGAHLSTEELLVATTRLEPDALLFHGSLPSSREALGRLLEKLRGAGVWPRMQVAVTGAVAGARECFVADAAAADPLEVLEVMALCPDYRAARPEEEPLGLLEGASPARGVDPAVVREFLSTMFPPRVHGN
jgi:methanogenic corrinoid protein MtbC1